MSFRTNLLPSNYSAPKSFNPNGPSKPSFTSAPNPTTFSGGVNGQIGGSYGVGTANVGVNHQGANGSVHANATHTGVFAGGRHYDAGTGFGIGGRINL